MGHGHATKREAEEDIMQNWCCSGTVLIPGKCWVASCEEPHSFSAPPNHRPGPGLNTRCPRPIPKGAILKATFSATTRGDFDYYIHHGPHDGLSTVSYASRSQLCTPYVETGSVPGTWQTLLAVAFFETTREISEPYWCWFDPAYRIVGDSESLPVRDATLVVQIVHDPSSDGLAAERE